VKNSLNDFKKYRSEHKSIVVEPMTEEVIENTFEMEVKIDRRKEPSLEGFIL
jgi:hypothetical protein